MRANSFFQHDCACFWRKSGDSLTSVPCIGHDAHLLDDLATGGWEVTFVGHAFDVKVESVHLLDKMLMICPVADSDKCM